MNIKEIENSLKRYIPPVLFPKLISYAANFRFLLTANSDTLKPNTELYKKRKSKRAFLLATGPSIKEQNLTHLQGEDCFSISNFFLHNEINKISPKLHFFAPFHPPLNLQNYADWLESSDKILPVETEIVLGYSDQKIVKQFQLFPHRKVYYLYLDRVSLKKNLRLDKPVPAPITGPQMILPVLISMGYEEIYLMGCDHTVMRDYKKKISNFYTPEKDMRKNATDGLAWGNIIIQLEANLKVFNLYESYKKYATDRHIKIINLSPDSWLDCFEFARYQDIIKMY